jgi:hypothetical protein
MPMTVRPNCARRRRSSSSTPSLTITHLLAKLIAAAYNRGVSARTAPLEAGACRRLQSVSARGGM